ncbi:hypothetical protein [Chryseolinea lacunae]|uniref:Uncharacterized protein n=1 Tax=Chryseolinea lacunae TaxID=2801331 RepID=A0ABS1KPN4_9BACT|nr:hypothetical protein [Chryseolinea lacunae]MBL0741391.1 hypothetical protein [Chryseolinea lacunae]
MKTIQIRRADGSITSIMFALGKMDGATVSVSWSINQSELSGVVVGEDYFACLLQIREIFEKDNTKILCNGARYDVYPSRMSRLMGKGTNAYVLIIGKQALEENLVDIFEPADLDKIGTVQQQRNYYNAWLDSLR